jgi:hypothetical protein
MLFVFVLMTPLWLYIWFTGGLDSLLSTLAFIGRIFGGFAVLCLCARRDKAWLRPSRSAGG